eukprot:jgi/Hompol1/333/HPOL_005281-RA
MQIQTTNHKSTNAIFILNIQLNEVMFDYTQCSKSATASLAPPPTTLSGVSSITAWKFDNSSNTCTIRFTVPTTLSKTVLMYIRITNMYQNHRLYYKSLDPDQLAGKVYASANDFPTSLETKCDYLQYANCGVASGKTWTIGNQMSYADNNPDCLASPRATVIANADVNAQYYPCGLVANSMFSDTISDLSCIGAGCRLSTYPFSASGIAWPEDSSLYKKTGWATDPTLQSQIPTKLIPPPQWRKAWPNLYGAGYNATNIPDLSQWERFQVWMRKAGLPQFRKLWGRNDNDSLDAGVWEVSIIDAWDVKRFEGTKSLVYSDVGFMGSKNSFLGIAFLTVGCTCALFVVIVGAYKP